MGAPRRAALLGAIGAVACAGATLQGRVLFPRGAPDVPPLEVLTEPEVCGGPTKPNESFLVGPEGGLANVVAELADLEPASRTLSTTPVMDQVGCVFRPHVLVARRRQPVLFRNSDPTFHNVNAHTVEGHYQAFNLGFPAGAPAEAQRLRPHGALVLRCDAGHSWMRAFVWAAEGPATATGADGRFVLEGVPAGRHRLILWHEVVGRAEVQLEVPPGVDEVRETWVARWRGSPAFVPEAEGAVSPPRPSATAPLPRPSRPELPTRRPRPVRRGEPGLPWPWVAAWAAAVLACGGALLALRRRRVARKEER